MVRTVVVLTTQLRFAYFERFALKVQLSIESGSRESRLTHDRQPTGIRTPHEYRLSGEPATLQHLRNLADR